MGGVREATESQREFASPRARLQKSAGFRSSSRSGVEGWGDWDERKEGRKDGEVRDDIDTRMERRGGLDGGRNEERHVTLSAGM